MSCYIEGLLKNVIGLNNECINEKEKMCEIQVTELQKMFSRIKLCKTCRSDEDVEEIEIFLSQYPNMCNYEIEGKTCQKWFGGVVNIHNTFHNKVNIRIAHHISLSWLTPQCKIRLSEEQFEQYQKIMKKFTLDCNEEKKD